MGCNFLNNFLNGFAFGMLASSPLVRGWCCFGGGNYYPGQVDFGTFANGFPCIFGNSYSNAPSPSPILTEFANPTYPTIDFTEVGKTIWDYATNPNSEFNKQMRDFFEKSNSNNNSQINNNQTYIPQYQMPFSSFYMPTQFTMNPFVYGYYNQSPTIYKDNADASNLQSLKKSSDNTGTEKKENTEKSAAVDAKNTGAKKSNASEKTWNEMTDAEMREVYGNYTEDITILYKGTADDLNKKLKGKGVLEGKGQAFMNAQKKYGISAAVLVAIAMNESGDGTSRLARKQNNIGGIRKPNSYEFRTFNSIEECIMEKARLLKNYYVNQGLTKLYQVNAKYCPACDPSDKPGNNALWASVVSRNLHNIDNLA